MIGQIATPDGRPLKMKAYKFFYGGTVLKFSEIMTVCGFNVKCQFKVDSKFDQTFY